MRELFAESTTAPELDDPDFNPFAIDDELVPAAKRTHASDLEGNLARAIAEEFGRDVEATA